VLRTKLDHRADFLAPQASLRLNRYGAGVIAPAGAHAPKDKSFLVLFFKKEPLFLSLILCFGVRVAPGFNVKKGASVLRQTIALFAALALLVSARPAVGADKIRLGILPFSEALGAVLADKEGFFAEEGIAVESTSFNSGAMALPLIQAGKLDIALSNTVSTLQAMEQGLDATILAPGAVVRDTAPDSTSALLVLKDTFKEPKDLIGKRIAVNVINSTAWLYLVAYLEQHGVSRNQVRFLEVPFPQMNDPLLNKQLDAINQVEPFSTIMLDTGKVDALAYSYVDTQPGGDITQYLALTEWVKQHPDLAKRFARAIIKGSAFANAPANQAETREVNMTFTHLSPALKDKVQIPRMGTAVNAGEISKTMDLMLHYGIMKQKVDLDGHILTVQ
jgi:NitT/TauT family transport system substrate-binding protein